MIPDLQLGTHLGEYNVLVGSLVCFRCAWGISEFVVSSLAVATMLLLC